MDVIFIIRNVLHFSEWVSVFSLWEQLFWIQSYSFPPKFCLPQLATVLPVLRTLLPSRLNHNLQERRQQSPRVRTSHQNLWHRRSGWCCDHMTVIWPVGRVTWPVLRVTSLGYRGSNTHLHSVDFKLHLSLRTVVSIHTSGGGSPILLVWVLYYCFFFRV